MLCWKLPHAKHSILREYKYIAKISTNTVVIQYEQNTDLGFHDECFSLSTTGSLKQHLYTVEKRTDMVKRNKCTRVYLNTI